MPHDVNGDEVKAGDLVTVRCKVISVSASPDYCNLTLETVEPMHPGDSPVMITLNAKQVEKAND